MNHNGGLTKNKIKKTMVSISKPANKKGEKIAETRGAIVYRGEREDGSPVIIKTLKTQLPGPSEIARFKHEYETIKRIDHGGVIKIHDIIYDQDIISLILEDFNGVSIEKILKNNKKIDVRTFLNIAIQLADTLGGLHDMNIIHKDVKPHNILMNRETSRVKLTDFGISTILTHENDEISHSDIIRGTLAYMSPEQTGRMNRSLDYRTDLYSLGITFYEILTGSVPFLAETPLELIHAHMAIPPETPGKRNPEIPEMISAIILKLLAKNAEGRYQSSFGLKADLEKCLAAYDQEGKIDDFELVTRDITNDFIIPEKLYGREKEIQTLHSIFSPTSNLPIKLLLVEGPPGIGKTALIHEFHKPLLARKGYFITGKFERLRRNTPYTAIITAFKGLIKEILSESNDCIQKWKEKIISAVGINGRLLTNLLPNLELIIGSQPDVAELDTEQGKNRFNFVFLKFVGVFAGAGSPVVLFLDDLQWADPDSFDLIEMILTNDDLKNLSMIASFRHDEVSAVRNLMEMVKRIEKKNAETDKINLETLPEKAIHQFLADLLKHPENQALVELGQLIHKKTNGNPFFVKQFLQTLHDEKLIFLGTNKKWQWDISAIETLKITDNVVTTLVKKIDQLPEKTKEILKIASCIGARFDLEVVSYLSNQEMGNILGSIEELMLAKLIDSSDNRYSFNHDRVQEAAYTLVPEYKKPEWHYKIGIYLLEKTPKEDFENKLFDIADQLNAGVREMEKQKDKKMLLNLARLNLKAGKKARISSAFDTAFSYFNSGIRLLPEESWEIDYYLTLEMYNEAADISCLIRQYKQAETFYSEIFNNARSMDDKVNGYITQIKSLSYQNKGKEAINVSIPILKQYGISLPSTPDEVFRDIGLKYSQIKEAIGKKDIQSFFLEKPIDETGYYNPASRISAIAGTSVYNQDKGLFLLIVLNSIWIHVQSDTLKPPSAFGFAGFAIALSGVFNDIDSAYRFGQLSTVLLEYPAAQRIKARTLCIVNGYINHFKKHIRSAISNFRNIYQIAVESGDFEYASLAMYNEGVVTYFSGIELEKVEHCFKEGKKAISELGQNRYLTYINVFFQTVLNLMHPENIHDSLKIDGDVYDEEIMLADHIKKNDQTALCNLYFNKLFLFYLFERFEEAVDKANLAMNHIGSVMSSANEPIHYFYDSLARIAMIANDTDQKITIPEKEKIIEQVEGYQVKMKNWANHAPMNYLHKYYLVEAEKLSVLGNGKDAEKYFNLAIDGAKEHDFLQEEALGYELFSKYFLKKQKKGNAKNYMRKAYACYSRWGATSKLKHLEENYGHLIQKSKSPSDKNPEKEMATRSHTDTTSITSGLDLSVVISSAQALSSEMDLSRLLQQIIKLAIENSGAQKSFLILEKDMGEEKELHIEAVGRIEKGKMHVEVLQSSLLSECRELSQAIVNYTRKTGENIVLSDAGRTQEFNKDPYISKAKPKSILCSPIRFKGKTAGIIYLENNLTTNAFTPERLEVLHILYAQAAISIENSFLVAEREKAAEIETEMKIAANIQTALLPKEPAINGYEISAYMKPADDVGGDYYDIINTDEADWVIIGDVSGHGVTAGLVMVMIQTAFLAYIHRCPLESPSYIFSEVNHLIMKNLNRMEDQKYMTATAFSVRPDGCITHAGMHQDILIYRTKENRIETIETSGMWIGITEDISQMLEDHTFMLDKDDVMLLYTDGIVEATKDDQMFEYERLEKILQENGTLSPSAIQNIILSELVDYHTTDDVTMVILKRTI